MKIEQRTLARVAVLSVSGDITNNTVGAKGITAAVFRALDAGERWFLLDLVRVRHVDSAGLGDLVQAQGLIKR